MKWGGSFENMQRAMARLKIIVPITIGLIFLLLFSSFNSVRYAGLIILNLPFSLIGGLVALWVTGEYLSVPASIGFINLFGVPSSTGSCSCPISISCTRDGLDSTMRSSRAVCCVCVLC